MTTNLVPLPADTNRIIVGYLLDLLGNALERHDGQAAVNVIDQLRVVAGPAWTDKLVDDLVTAGLRRLAQRIQQGGQ